ncbi:MAG: prolipoprotein diacylglyceryl transferase, partial [Gammaproteobacteria bacterium]|nr:prolipoprotein diacylglyceryl transferase [Gammaproteobacteria bacterium]
VAFVVGGVLGLYRAKRSDGHWTGSMVWDLVFYVAVGAVLGGRLGYVVFYNATFYLANPVEIFSVWTGGMSFHGGLIGVIVAVALFAKRVNVSFFAVADAPWAVVFPAGGPLPRHPSQLYEAALEGVVLFLLVWFYSARPRAAGRVSGLFLLGYALMRLLVEFFREPDAHLGFIFLESVTMGQILSVPVGLFGLWLLLRPEPKTSTARS